MTAAYLNTHLHEDDSEEVFLLALRDVARANGATEVAESANLGRESLDPKLSTP